MIIHITLKKVSSCLKENTAPTLQKATVFCSLIKQLLFVLGIVQNTCGKKSGFVNVKPGSA